MKASLFEVEKKWKDTAKLRMAFETDKKRLEAETQQEMKENYENKMKIDKGEQFEKLKTARHELELKLVTDFKNEKTEEQARIVDSRAKEKVAFESMNELQTFINEAKRYK